MKKTSLISILMSAALITTVTGCGAKEASPAASETTVTENASAATEAVSEAVSTEESSKAEKSAETDRTSLPRTVITTDGEVDDMNSVIRALLYSNEMDIAGIVLTSSMYHYAGDEDKGIEPFRWTGTDWIYEYLDSYEEVLPNLKKHDPNYPDADSLRKITKIGNISNKGEMEEVTEGSEFLKDLFLDDDERTLYVQTWGGTNTTARALKSIEEEYSETDQWEEIQKKIYDKLVLYIILDQDESYSDYIAKSWPELTIINDRSNFWHFAYAWQLHDDSVNTALHADWNEKNLLNKGALMDHYALMGDGNLIEGELDEEQRGSDEYLKNNPDYVKYDFISEGDSPSFLYLVNNGLRSLENPSYGGWGGRFGLAEDSDNRWINNVLDYDKNVGDFEAIYTLTRWFDDIQNDFAARADWCVAENYEDANHAPSVTVKEGLDITAKAGETVTLTAEVSDPDGDSVSVNWWRYAEADSYQDEKREVNEMKEDDSLGMLLNITREPIEDEEINSIVIEGSSSETASFKVPEDAKSGDTIHIICEAEDDGAHHLKHYARVIVTVEK
ncbi:MAG: DUF1593 domain-containing protein [Lachnospiraceae bacterium]|nr:DUF1593 domain-containing protein [Lachnospiraceae bacterium]